MKKSLLVCFAVIFILSACNLPRQTQTASPEDVETQVIQLLTTIPTLTKAPTVTKIPPTSTTEPTEEIPTATQTFTLAPTATGIPATPTAAGTDPRNSLGSPTYQDTMVDGGGFFTYSDEHVKFDPEDDSMLMLAFKPDSWHGWSLSGVTLTDAYIEMTAKPGTCSGADRYGLVLRSQDPTQGYFVGFSCDGRYSMRKWDGSDFTTITDWTSSDKIISGANQANRLGVMMKGSTFTIYTNGAQVGQVDDTSYEDGKFGIFIASSATADFSVTVDEVDYWDLD